MKKLASLFEKFKNLKNPREEKEDIKRIIESCLGFEISYDDISIREATVFLNVSGYVKTEVFMKREDILIKLKEAEKKIKEIK